LRVYKWALTQQYLNQVQSNDPEDPPLSEEHEGDDAGGKDPGLSGFGRKRKQPSSSVQASKKAKKNAVSQQAQGGRPEKSCNSWRIQLSKANSGRLFCRILL